MGERVPETVVVVLDPCVECNGEGVVADPTGFYERARARGLMAVGASNDAWEAFVAREGYEKLPLEEAVCHECEGARRLPHEVTLLELAARVSDAKAAAAW